MYMEGIDFRFRIKPITATILATILVAGGAGFGWMGNSLLTKVPVVRDLVPTPTPPTPTPDPWRDTAYAGILRKVSEGKYYLQTGEGQAVTLSVPQNVNLEKLIGRRIFASGRFNLQTQVLEVESATDLEVLPQSAVLVPTISPSPTPTITPTL